jgi:hypothetical protein
LVNIEAEYAAPEAWKLWLRENRGALPQPWPEKGEGQVASDGSVHFGVFRMLDFDPLEQSYTRQVRLEKWIDGVLAVSEEYTLRGNMYFKNELLLMLAAAGFRDVTVFGDYTENPATAENEILVFRAIR